MTNKEELKMRVEDFLNIANFIGDEMTDDQASRLMSDAKRHLSISELEHLLSELPGTPFYTELTMYEVQLQKYKADSTLYSLSLDAALKRFSARVEKEKLSNDAYRSDIDAEKTRFVAEMDMLKTDKLLSLEEYKARIDVLIKQSELLLRQLGPLAQVGSQHIQSAGGVAQAAANSLNTMVSLSETGA
jgi:hypothetical protein